MFEDHSELPQTTKHDEHGGGFNDYLLSHEWISFSQEISTTLSKPDSLLAYLSFPRTELSPLCDKFFYTDRISASLFLINSLSTFDLFSKCISLSNQ